MEDEKDQQEQLQAERRASPSGTVVYRAVLMEGRDELDRPSSALFWSGLAAGLSMGTSLMAEGLLSSYLPEATWRPLIAKLGYSVGFLLVILGRQQLFTENTLTPILPLLREKTWHRLLNVARLWTIVLVANLLGCVAVAWLISTHWAFNPEVQSHFVEIGHRALVGTFGEHFVRATLAGWLIALMVWVLPFAESARVWVIILISYLVGIGQLSHIIAGAVEVFYTAIAGQASWGQVLGHHLLPTFLGNALGGVALVAAINHAQVFAGYENRDI